MGIQALEGIFTLTTLSVTSVPLRFDCNQEEFQHAYDRCVKLSAMRFLCPSCGTENAGCIRDGTGSDAVFYCPECLQEWSGDAALE